MKFPGTYAAYAVIMSIFGQTITGIHLGLLLVNAATIVLIFFLGRQLVNSTLGTCRGNELCGALCKSLRSWVGFSRDKFCVVTRFLAGH